MRLLRRGTTDGPASTEDPAAQRRATEDPAAQRRATEDPAADEPGATTGSTATARPPGGRGRTAGKGRPTPSRRQSQGHRGPVAPAPTTQREAMRRAKSLRGSKKDRRKAASDRRARMAAGDDAVLPARERGPVKAYVRDVVDSRRHFMGLLMPMAFLVFALLLIRNPVVQSVGTTVVFVVFVAMVLEGLLVGRQVVGRARARFPDQHVSAPATTWYAFTRATQIRKVRVPSPRVRPGEHVA